MPTGSQGPPAPSLPDIDKIRMGQRIKQLRQEAGLRQWELARRLGTTQSAVHKYEHGVVPEPRRLLELARLGNTSIEWILTGRHWENGSEERERVSADLLETAALLRRLDREQRASLDRALEILRDAVESLGPGGEEPTAQGAPAAGSPYREEALQVLEAAVRVQQAVLRRIARQASGELDRTASGLSENSRGPHTSRPFSSSS
jgi:transcriptional regulator with XRE-family HTH domain